MSDKRTVTIDMEAVRRAAYAVEIGATCDRADLVQLCALARELAPKERVVILDEGETDVRQLRAQVWALTTTLLDLGVKWEGGSGHAAAGLLRSMHVELTGLREAVTDVVESGITRNPVEWPRMYLSRILEGTPREEALRLDAEEAPRGDVDDAPPAPSGPTSAAEAARRINTGDASVGTFHGVVARHDDGLVHLDLIEAGIPQPNTEASASAGKSDDPTGIPNEAVAQNATTLAVRVERVELALWACWDADASPEADAALRGLLAELRRT